MSRQRIPLAGPADGRRVVNMETDATIGATVGTNLYLADGTVVTADMILNRDDPIGGDSYSPTLWRLISEVPLNIVAVAALTGGGFAFMDSIGVWRVRMVGRQVFNFGFGSSSPIALWTTPHGLHIVQTRVVVVTPWNGTGAALEVGTVATPGLLLPLAAVDLRAAASYEYASDAQLLSGVAIRATMTAGSGASAGAGKILIDTIPLEGI